MSPKKPKVDPNDTDVLHASVAIKVADRFVARALKAQQKEVARGIRVSRNALLAYLAKQSQDTLSLPKDLSADLMDIWAAQYRWTPYGSTTLVDYIGGLLEDSGWDVMLKGTSNPSPRVKEELKKGATIHVHRVGTP